MREDENRDAYGLLEALEKDGTEERQEHQRVRATGREGRDEADDFFAPCYLFLGGR